MVQMPELRQESDGTWTLVIGDEVLQSGMTDEQADNAFDGALQALEYDGE